ncbi:MAG: VCBS repeat-containing protein [Puniceicoccales bacterium]|nr:VCBS repeat-containing protein [Puniceicoccales bacterium]
MNNPPGVMSSAAMLKRFFPIFLFAVLTCLPDNVLYADGNAGSAPAFKKVVLSREFFAEGSHYGDFNKDGKLDVIAGPYWYEGPDFVKKHEIYAVKAFDPKAYSDNFTCYGADLNGDGWDDVLICPHPGTRGYWFENPKGGAGHWKKHFTVPELGNESPQLVEIHKGAGKSLLYNNNGWLGYATAKLKNGVTQWDFLAISTKERRFERYTHGVGCGDINGDGRIDIIEKNGWWEHPEDSTRVPWTFHKQKFAVAASQMFVFDVDGDGLNDVVCVWQCHLYGLSWYKQIRSAEGKIEWQRHDILADDPDKAPGALRISQMHALAVADINGDGLPDLVTGKRFWAHGPKGDIEADAPAVLYWFELKRDGKGGASFIPHKIDDDSGVGTQVTTVDLNGDKVPDIIVSNKKGTFLFLSER